MKMSSRGMFLLFYIIIVFVDALGQERILSFQSCQVDSDCYENSYCYLEATGRRKCRCKEDFLLSPYNKTTYECLPVVGFGDDCILEVQCQVKLGSLATCDESSNTCKCINDAHLGNNDMCHETVALGGVCKTNNNCLLNDGKYGFCFAGTCICNSREHAVENENRCVASSNLNERCEFQENCLQEFSNCNGGICRCIPGYVESENNIKCLIAASSIGENCTQTIQCSEYVKGSFCYNNICTCKSAYHGYGNECVPDAKLGDRCSEDKECIITSELEDSVRCTNQTCTCIEGLSNEHFYGCFIRSKSYRVLPSVSFIVFAYLKLVLFL